MTDKLTAAGLKASLKVQKYLAFSGAPSLGTKPQNPLVVVHGYAMVRKDVADAAILALEDMRTQMMARIAELEAENKRLKEKLKWEVEVRDAYQRRQIDRLRIRAEKAEKALEALDD